MDADSLVMMGEEAEWSASTATLPLDQTSPRSLADDDEEEEELAEAEAWSERRSRTRTHSGGNTKGLRALLLEMDVEDDQHQSYNHSHTKRTLSSSSSSFHKAYPHHHHPHSPQEQESDDDDQQDRGGGGGRRNATATRMELRHAEERVRTLEARLLDAEETIYHLKAEKMEAWRRVEQLSRTRSPRDSDAPNSDNDHAAAAVVKLRTQMYELEGQLQDAQTQHAMDQEQHMAVIREQEQELLDLRERLVQVQDHAHEVELQNEELRNKLTSTLGTPDRYHAVKVNGEGEEDEEEEEDKHAAERTRTSVTPNAQWIEELVRHPTPPFDLDSPEVQYWLCAWTSNATKRQYLRTWLLHVAVPSQRDLPLEFPLGIELPRLAPEIRDGFLTLVLPLLRKQTWREVVVHTREYNDQYHTDVRVRVEVRRP